MMSLSLMLSSVDTHHKHIRSALPGSADFKDAGAVLCSTKKTQLSTGGAVGWGSLEGLAVTMNASSVNKKHIAS